MKAVCILSWRSPEILEKTLETYKKNKLFDFFDEKLILFQEITQEDINVATKYGIPYLSTEKNIGIEAGWRKILEHVQSDYVLMLENDCPVIEPSTVIATQLNTAIELLSKDIADIVRLRSITAPGEKFDTINKYKSYYCNNCCFIKRLLRPFKARRLIGSAIYSISNPDKKHPHELKKYNSHCYITNSAHLNWTNQSVIFNKRFVLHTLLNRVQTHPSNRLLNGFQDIERALNCQWWRKSKFPIGVCSGIFTHQRLM